MSVLVDKKSALGRLMSELIVDARAAVPGLYDIGIDGEESRERELHISLSRPIYLRAHQREDLKKAVKTLAKHHGPYATRTKFLSLNPANDSVKMCQVQSFFRYIIGTRER